MSLASRQEGAVAKEELCIEDFDAIAAFALREFGLSLPRSKRQLVQSRLARRVRVLSLSSFSSYRKFLEKDDGVEKAHLLSALTTNVTKFFREIHHFEVLIDEVLPLLISRAKRGERIRIWSAGCSSGQEPYSIALTALMYEPKISEYNFKILATDIDPLIIEKAKNATYRDDEIRGISSRFFRPSDINYLDKTPDSNFSPSTEARSLVTFGVVNLVKALPFSGAFDVIFCRNVAIYFDHKTQQTVWARFAELLPTGGKLFIGHSERIKQFEQPYLTPDGVTIYRKI